MQICTFYQKGVCAYGSRCRYEHVKVSVAQATAPSSQDVSGTVVCRASITSDSVTKDSASSRPLFSSMRSSLKGNLGHHDIPDDDYGAECISKVDRVNQPICSFASVGDCPHGEKCPFVHDEVRPICGKQCLHHLWPQEREQHMQTCDKRQKQALQKSHEIECSVCLELVLSKPTLGERKFGILPECDHPFCISCIRNWRNSSPESGLDVNSALRACPICRKISYFVVPSVIWYFSKEEKQEIIDHYKAKLRYNCVLFPFPSPCLSLPALTGYFHSFRSIDCKYFDFGNGSCPFGTSCFYKACLYNF